MDEIADLEPPFLARHVVFLLGQSPLGEEGLHLVALIAVGKGEKQVVHEGSFPRLPQAIWV